MTDSPDKPAAHHQRRITLASGGWVLLLAGALVLVILVWQVLLVLHSRGSQAVGDGRNPATYGFDLSTCLVPPDLLVGSGLPKDGLPVLDDPPVLTATQCDALNRELRGHYLVSADRVIGVRIAGHARAYPLRVLNWHEIVNDTVGGVPVAVTYSPLCDSVVVFHRRINGETVRFGFSGLLYNSNLVMYDRRPAPRGESLWSQLQCRAVAGPAAADARRLQVLPAALVHWSDWRARHPDTEVLEPDLDRIKRYKRNPYGSYYGSQSLRFPVRPPPPENGPLPKAPLVVVGAGGSRRAFLLDTIAGQAGPDGVWNTSVGGQPVVFTYRDAPPTVLLQPQPASTESWEVMHSFWFAWHATHPDADVE